MWNRFIAGASPPLDIKQLTKWNVLSTVGAKWRGLADLLGFDPGVTTGIGGQYNNNANLCCREVLTLWLQGEGSAPRTWEELLDNLEALKFKVFVGQLRQKLNA